MIYFTVKCVKLDKIKFVSLIDLHSKEREREREEKDKN